MAGLDDVFAEYEGHVTASKPTRKSAGLDAALDEYAGYLKPQPVKQAAPAKPLTATEQYKADGGGLAKSIEKGFTALTTLMAPAAAIQTKQAAAILALMGDKRAMAIANDATLPQRALEAGVQQYNSLPKNPIGGNVAQAYEAESGINAPLAAIREFASNPGLAADYMAEMLPAAVPGGLVGGTGAKLAADQLLARAIIPNIVKQIAPKAAAGAGANSGATFSGGMIPNAASAYEENGGSLGAALRTGGKQTLTESAVAAPFGAVLPFGNRVLPTTGKALVVSPVDEVAQTVAGNAAIGKQTSGGEMMAAGLLGATSSPADIATAIIASKQGEQAQPAQPAPETAPQPQPAPPADTPDTPDTPQPTSGLDAALAEFSQYDPDATSDPMNPQAATPATQQFGATVETAQPVNLAEAFRAVAETPPPRAIVETPGPRGIVETAAPIAEKTAGVFAAGDTVEVNGKIETVDSVGPDGWVYTKAGAAGPADQFTHAVPRAPIPSSWGGLVTDNPSESFKEFDARQKQLAAEQHAAIEPQPAPPADLLPADLISQPGEMVEPVTDATSPELRDLTEGLIRQMRDAKQLDLDHTLRRAIDRIKTGGVNEKPAYFTKLAKEFEKRGDTKTAGMLNAVATTIKARQRAIPKPAVPKVPKTKVSALATKDPGEYGEAARRVFLQVIKKAGGVSIEDAADITGETRVNSSRMSPGFFATGAPGIDLVARRLHEAGYITDAEYNEADGGVQVARDLINNALRKQPVLTSEQQERMAELEAMEADNHAVQQEQAEQDMLADILGDNLTDAEFARLHDGVPIDEAADQAGSDRAAQQEQDDGQSADIERQAGEAQPRGAEANPQGSEGQPGREPLQVSVQSGELEAGNASGNAGVPSRDGGRQDQDFSLAQQTERDLAERERELNRREAEQNARERAALEKEKADRQRDDFSLTGSERASDANAGQGDLLSISGNLDQIDSAPTKPEPVAAQETTSAPAKTEKQSKTVENFGETLPPARRSMAAKLDESLTDDIIAVRPLSEIWPQAENEAIEDTFAAAVAHAARAEIPAKPRVGYKVKQWVKKVQILRELAAKIVSGRVSRDEFINTAGAYSLRDWIGKVKLLEQLPRDQWKRIETVEERPDAYTYQDNIQVPAPSLRLVIDGKPHYLRNGGTVADNMAEITALLEDAAPEKRMEFEIRHPRSGGKYFINKKGDGQYRHLMEFDTVEEARSAIRSQYDALVGEWENVKARDNITERDLRSTENRPRVGKDHRGGRDVTPEEFQTSFGFRGGEFGKWVQQGKGDKNRQDILNSAFDALHDLADIVGVPPAAISLNGTLGIAFGSRGSGWASAHFEPSNLVINLTKTRGAGALAHEWFHALDNYFSRLRGGEVAMAAAGSQKAYRDQNYITHQPEPLMVRKNSSRYSEPMTLGKLKAMHEARKHLTDTYNPDNWQRDPKHREGVRPEVEQRFAALVEALNESPMTKRARLLDGKKSGDGYWSSTLERAARTFENFVQARMLEDGYHNDFLANVKAANETGKNDARYPYLMPGEIKPIAEAFDALFGEIKTKETDSGIALFSRGHAEAAGGRSAILQDELDHVIDRVAAGWKRPQGFDGGTIRSVDSPAGLPAAILRQADVQNVPHEEIKSVLHNGHVYLVRENLKDALDAELAIFHEAYGHLGALLFFGPDAAAVQKAFVTLWDRVGHLDGVRKMADKFGVRDDLEPYIRSIQTADLPLATKQRIIMDELLAHVQGRGDFTLKEQAKAYLGALLVGLRNAARAMKLDGIAQALDGYTDAELLLNLKQMREAVVSGAGGKGNGTLFARKTPAGPNSPQQPLRLQPGQGFTIDPETRAEGIQRRHQDKMNRWAKVQRQIKEQGGTVELDQDVYHAMERMTGRAADRIDQFTHETVRPLLKRVADLKTSLEEVGTYLMALGAKDRNAYIQSIRQDMPGNGSGMSDAEAAKIIADYQTRADFAEFDAVARDFQKLTERKLKVLVGGGVIDQAHADNLTQSFGFYVPYKGFETIDEDGNRTGGTGSGYSTPKRFSKQAFGRVSKAGQVVENIIRDYEQAVILAEKANVGRYVRNLANANPDATLWTVDQPPSQPVMKGGIVSLMQKGFDNQDEIRFIENGREVRIQLHDKLLAETYNNLGDEPLTFIMKAGDTVNRILRQTYTQKNPAFILVNAVRDLQTGLAVMTGEMGMKSAIKALRHAPGAWKTASSESRNRGSVTGEWAKYMDAYRKTGAQTAYYAVGDIEAKQAKLEELLAREGGQTFINQWKRHGGGLKGAKATAKLAAWRTYNNTVVDVIESLNGGFENMMRLAAFRQYIDDHGGLNGASKETLAEASRIAKNLTVNFNRKGEKTRGMNALYLFWNANVQGTNNLYRAATKTLHSKEVKAIYGGMVGLGFMLSLMTGDEEDDLTPDYTKGTSIVIHLGDGKRVQIPLAYGLGYFVALGYEIGNLIQDRETPVRAAMNIVGSALMHFSPLGNPIHDGKLDSKDVIVAATPTVLKPAVMSGMNRNQFGYEVVPKYGDDTPDRPAMRANTKGGTYDAAAGGMEWLGADVSPETLKMVTTFITGGLGTFIGDTGTAGMVASKGGFDPEKTPILKRFYGENDVEEHRARFYNLAEDVQGQAREQGKKQKEFFGNNRAADSVQDYKKRMKTLRDKETAAHEKGNERMVEAAQTQQIRLADAFKKEHDRMVKRHLIERR